MIKFLGNLKAISIIHYFTIAKCQIRDTVSTNKWSTVFSTATGFMFNFPPERVVKTIV
jgi:hypothetical protein